MGAAISYALFGLIVGSFLNVVVLRKNMLSLGGRSECMSCGAQLRWYDMVPVLSWLALAGRCRTCGSSISIQYPLVEASTALIFGCIGGTTLVFNVPVALTMLLIAAALIAIATYDILHTIIPDMWAYFFAGAAIVYVLLTGIPVDASWFMYALSGPVAALPIFTLWLVSGGRWIGLGDAKLSLGIGWLLGPVYGIGAVFFAFVIGAIISVFLLMPLPHVLQWFSKRGIGGFRIPDTALTMKSEVPFGPYLVASTFIVWFSLLYNLPLPW
jgi:leader peptidase (prepilin peptidase)/N-methyltransferase